MPVIFPERKRVLQQAAELAKPFESFKAKPYLCPAGVWTIGYGTTEYPDGRKVTSQDEPCTIAQADEWLKFRLARDLDFMQKKIAVSLNEYQMAAMLDLVYNIGPSAWANSTMLRRVNMGDLEGAADQFLVWNKARVEGELVPLKGLTRRREAEKKLFERM